MGVEEPKKPKNSYWLFLEERRPVLEQQVPKDEKKLPWVAKTAGTEWKALSDSDKAKYEAKAAAEKETYEKALEQFKAAGGVPATREKKIKKGEKEKKVVDETKPKKAKSAYFIFLDEQRPILQKEAPEGEKVMPWVAKTGAARWKDLSDDKKAPYEEKAAAAKKLHEEAVSEWKASKPAAVSDESKTSKPAAGAVGDDDAKTPSKKRSAKPKKQAADKSPGDAATSGKAVKKPAAESSSKSTPKKRGREPPVPEIDVKVLVEATKLGYDGALRNLAARPEMIGKPAAVLLKALQASNGLVNPAKRALTEN